MTALLAFLLLLSGQDDWSKRRAAFTKAFSDGDTMARCAAIRSVGQADRVEAAELLVKAWTDSELRVRRADEKHPIDFDAERKIRGEIALAIGSMTDAVAARFLAAQLRDSTSEDLRELVAAAAWRLRGPVMIEQLGRTLKSERSPIVLAAAISSVRAIELTQHRAAIVEYVKHAHWRVRLAAVSTVAAWDVFDAVESLVELLADEGQLRAEVNDALITLTGVDKHGDHATWYEWLESEGRRVLDEPPVRTQRLAALDAARRSPQTRVMFYGVPVVSRRVIFVVDVSGSMLEKAEWRPESELPRPVGDLKIDVARYELKRAIDRLPSEAMFNVVAFNTKMYWASDGMMQGEADDKKMCLEWIDRWKPEGGTNSHGALIRALEIAGAHKQRLAADTIYFISDGKPTLGTPEWILGKVREKNPHAKVVIHGIAVGVSADRGFMEALAEENAGSYTER